MKNIVMKKILPRAIGAYLNTLSYLAPGRVGEIGYNIFCTPISPPVKPHHKQWLDTAHQFNFESDGILLQAYQWGHGEKKILFLHGWQSHSYRWKKYIEAFPQNEYTIYAFDAPAHGLSEGKYANIPIYSNAIENFIESVGVIDFAVTHSMGSFALMHALHHHHHLSVGHFVAMGSPGEANDFISFYKKFTGLSDRTFKHIIDHFEKVLKRTPDYFSAPVFATSLEMPGLIIHDEGDEEAPYHHAVRIHKAWPQSRLITTQGFGHNLRSQEVVEMVKDFVKEEQVQSIGTR